MRHLNGIHSLTKVYARAGYDGTIIVWDMKCANLLQSINRSFNGPVLAVAWLQPDDEGRNTFVFGCADGYLHL